MMLWCFHVFSFVVCLHAPLFAGVLGPAFGHSVKPLVLRLFWTLANRVRGELCAMQRKYMLAHIHSDARTTPCRGVSTPLLSASVVILFVLCSSTTTATAPQAGADVEGAQKVTRRRRPSTPRLRRRSFEVSIGEGYCCRSWPSGRRERWDLTKITTIMHATGCSKSYNVYNSAAPKS